MPAEWSYAWRGIDRKGRRRRGRHIACDAAAARAALQAGGIVVFSLAVRRAPRPPVPRAAAAVRLLKHLAALLQAGLPLLSALEVIRAGAPQRPAGRIAGLLARAVGAGVPLAAAMASHPRVFTPLCTRMVAVGEASATLADMLARVAEQQALAAARRAKLKGALAYPLAVLVLSLGVTCALITWVVPSFADVFAQWQAPLPAPTRAVLSLSASLPALAVPAGMTALAGIALAAAARRMPRLRLALHRAWLAVPVAGEWTGTSAAARWSRALGTLLGAGVPVVAAFETLRGITGNAAFDMATERIAAGLLRGDSLARAMQQTGRFPSEFVHGVAIAEQSAMLDTMLGDLATLGEQHALEAIERLCGWAEPVVVTIVGVLTGGLVLAMYLPIIRLGDVV